MAIVLYGKEKILRATFCIPMHVPIERRRLMFLPLVVTVVLCGLHVPWDVMVLLAV